MMPSCGCQSCEERYWLDAIAELEEEIERLKEWKESALKVMPPMQKIAKTLDLPLGESIHDKILPEIERLKAKVERLENLIFLMTNCPKKETNYER